MIVYGIDPGPAKSALSVFDTDNQRVLRSHTSENEQVLMEITAVKPLPASMCYLAVERILSYGRPVGETVFETVFWTGRFIEAWKGQGCYRISFRDVGKHLCNSGSGVKESHVRQALIDRFGPERKDAVGTKQNKGPLYGVANHQWSSTAVAVTAGDQKCRERDFPDGTSSRNNTE